MLNKFKFRSIELLSGGNTMDFIEAEEMIKYDIDSDTGNITIIKKYMDGKIGRITWGGDYRIIELEEDNGNIK